MLPGWCLSSSAQRSAWSIHLPSSVSQHSCLPRRAWWNSRPPGLHRRSWRPGPQPLAAVSQTAQQVVNGATKQAGTPSVPPMVITWLGTSSGMLLFVAVMPQAYNACRLASLCCCCMLQQHADTWGHQCTASTSTHLQAPPAQGGTCQASCCAMAATHILLTVERVPATRSAAQHLPGELNTLSTLWRILIRWHHAGMH